MTSTTRHLQPADYRRMRWRNGLGWTSEIAALADPAKEGAFLWRLSIAEIETDCDFSAFSGYARTIMLLDGHGMVLAFSGRGAPAAPQRLDKPWIPLAFSGDWTTRCRLIDGPCRDFNLMVERRWGHGRMTVVESGRHSLQGADCWAIHALGRPLELALDDDRMRLAPGDSLLGRRPGPAELVLDGPAVLIELAEASRQDGAQHQ